MFKKLFDELMVAETVEQIYHILYRNKSDTEDYGVDIAYQREKISAKDHERLFKLAGIIERCLKNEKAV